MTTDNFVKVRLPPPSAQPEFRYDLPALAALKARPQLNIVHELLDRAVSEKGFANRPMLRSPRLTLRYAEVQDRVNRIAQVLVEDLGLTPGQRVLLRGGNSIGMALAWLGVVKAGLIAVATMPLLRAKELGEIIEKAQPLAALCDASLLAELMAAQSALMAPTALTARFADPVLRRIVPFNVMNGPGANQEDAGSGLAMLTARKNGRFTAHATAADDIALMAFTSGTTGKAKAVVHSHLDVLASCETWPRHVLKLTASDVVMGSPPLAFTFGLGGLLIFPMWAGASVYFPDAPYTPEGMARLSREAGATVCFTAPTFYRQMAPFMARHPSPTVRACVSAGEVLPDATRALWKAATGIDMLDGIGATEMFHIFISSAGADVRHGAIGKVVPGYTAKVVDDAGVEVPRGTVGKLAVKGPTGCRYADDPRQANYVKDGWNYPGDAFVQDEDGYFFYQSRTDDMIITAGYNVGGPEVEDCLLQHPAVAECGVIGQPDAERGMIVKAFVVLKPGHVGDEATVKTLQDHAKARLAPFKYPREIQFVSSLPRTESGKLQRFKLKSA